MEWRVVLLVAKAPVAGAFSMLTGADGAASVLAIGGGAAVGALTIGGGAGVGLASLVGG